MEPPGIPFSKGRLGGERLTCEEKNSSYVSKQMRVSSPPPPTDFMEEIPRGMVRLRLWLRQNAR